MRTFSLIGGSSVTIACVALVVACGDSGLPTRPGTLTVSGVEINGPATVAPGQSVQFFATLRMSDGSSRAAKPAEVAGWDTSNSRFLRVTPFGLATGQESGEAALSLNLRVPASTAILRSVTTIIVVPAGTYRLTGVVRDAEFPSQVLLGARVEATPGTVLTTTNGLGQYRLYGVAADATVRVTRDGYQTLERSLQLSTNSTHDFLLTQSEGRLSLTGPYTLAIDVLSGCAPDSDSPFPADLQHRRYDAVLTQNGPTVNVTLTEPRFRIDQTGRGNGFSGHVDASGVTFDLALPALNPHVVERLPDGTFLVAVGTVVMTGNAAGLSGHTGFQIRLDNYSSEFPQQINWIGGCGSESVIRFTLTPR